MTREELLKRIDDGRADLLAQLARVPAERLTQPTLANGWSVKDMLAHLATWERRVEYLYRMLSSGRPVEDGVTDSNVYNATTYEANRHRPLAEIQAEETAAFLALRTVAETAPEADLFDPARFAWTEDRAFCDWIAWNSYDHYLEHLPDLRASLDS